MKKILYDTEFIEGYGFVDLISLGAVDMDGNEFYEISSEFDEKRLDLFNDNWVRENVIERLDQSKERISKEEIRRRFVKFCGVEDISLYAYYADYDHVALMSLFGRMVDQPTNFPMFTIDLQQECERLGFPKPPTPENEHHALADARWNKELLENLIKAGYLI